MATGTTWGRQGSAAAGAARGAVGGARSVVGGIPPIVTWTLVTVGAWLVYASVRGLSPLAELSAALTGGSSPGSKSLGVSVGSPAIDPTGDAAAGAADPKAVTHPVTAKAPPRDLVPIGQGSFRLAAATNRAFQAWQGAFGHPITLTDAYRTWEQQAAGYASDPHRFAAPDKSRHVRGEAVDVNLQALGANAATENAMWKALYAAALATGWCNPRGPYKGDHSEPWHFSYPGCG